MAGRRSVKSVQRVHYDINGRIETERGCCRFEIVVDRLRYTDAVDASLLQLLRSHQRSVAANDDQRSHAEVLQDLPGVCNDLCRNDGPIARADFCNEMAAISGTKDCPAQRHDSVYSLSVENDVIARWHQPFKSVAKTNHFPAKLVRCEHYGAQNRIKPGTIATAGQNTNARFHFRRSEIRGLFWDQPSAPQPPIDRTTASRVASEMHLLRTGSCCLGAPPLGDGDKLFPSGRCEQLPIHDLHTKSNSRQHALNGLSSLRRCRSCRGARSCCEARNSAADLGDQMKSGVPFATHKNGSLPCSLRI